ncbi:trypsin-like serine protease [Vibrio vulnificus]|nr:trypsin-like serine protease [Vibrio vulnificus]
MRRTLLFASLTLASSSAWAIINGTPVDWPSHDNLVRLDGHPMSGGVIQDKKGQCTGTLISGKYVLTAAHCLDKENVVDSVTMASGQNTSTEFAQYRMHPNYDPSADFSTDVGLIPLNQVLVHQSIQFFSDLSISNISKGEAINVKGFGGTATASSPLNQAEFTFSKTHWASPELIYIDVVNDSHTTGGDSGSAWSNDMNEIIGVHNGSSFNFTTNKRSTYGTDLHYASDFILETINGWHYPTIANANGQTTITIQSLHQSVNQPDPSNEMWTEGDVALVNEASSCFNQALSPYKKCTLVVESQGAEGVIWLSANEAIYINKPIKQPEGGSSSSASGASFGFWSLLVLAGLAWGRRRQWK